MIFKFRIKMILDKKSNEPQIGVIGAGAWGTAISNCNTNSFDSDSLSTHFILFKSSSSTRSYLMNILMVFWPETFFWYMFSGTDFSFANACQIFGHKLAFSKIKNLLKNTKNY